MLECTCTRRHTLPRSVRTGFPDEDGATPASAGCVPKNPSPHWYTSPRASMHAPCRSCSPKSRSATSFSQPATDGVRTDSGTCASADSTCVLNKHGPCESRALGDRAVGRTGSIPRPVWRETRREERPPAQEARPSQNSDPPRTRRCGWVRAWRTKLIR